MDRLLHNICKTTWQIRFWRCCSQKKKTVKIAHMKHDPQNNREFKGKGSRRGFTRIPRDDPQREGIKNENCGGRGKKAKFWAVRPRGGPAEGGPAEGGPAEGGENSQNTRTNTPTHTNTHQTHPPNHTHQTTHRHTPTHTHTNTHTHTPMSFFLSRVRFFNLSQCRFPACFFFVPFVFFLSRYREDLHSWLESKQLEFREMPFDVHDMESVSLLTGLISRGAAAMNSCLQPSSVARGALIGAWREAGRGTRIGGSENSRPVGEDVVTSDSEDTPFVGASFQPLPHLGHTTIAGWVSKCGMTVARGCG